MECQPMSDSKTSLQKSLDEALKMHTSYAKSRLVWQLAGMTSALIPEVLLNLLNSCSVNYDWSDEEQAQIKRIVNVLGAIHGHLKHLESLSLPLINTYKRPSLSAPTSTHDQTMTDVGDATTSRQE